MAVALLATIGAAATAQDACTIKFLEREWTVLKPDADWSALAQFASPKQVGILNRAYLATKWSGGTIEFLWMPIPTKGGAANADHLIIGYRGKKEHQSNRAFELRNYQLLRLLSGSGAVSNEVMPDQPGDGKTLTKGKIQGKEGAILAVDPSPHKVRFSDKRTSILLEIDDKKILSSECPAPGDENWLVIGNRELNSGINFTMIIDPKK
jgi:hypothetical protein